MTNNPNPSRLNDEERSKLRGEFLAYMDMHPVQTAAALPSPYAWSFLRAPVAYALVLVFLFGGTAYASERALPSDVFYGVKTEVIEPAVLGSVSFSRPLKAKVAAALVERRLDEAALLSESGRLGTEETEELVQRLDEHVEVIAATAREADAPDTEEIIDVGLELEASLEVHAERFAGKSDGLAMAAAIIAEPSDSDFVGKLRSLSVVADEITASAEERLVEAVEDGSDYVEARASEISLTVDALRASEPLGSEPGTATTTEAQELLEVGRKAQSMGDLDAALESFREAEQSVIESRLLLEASGD